MATVLGVSRSGYYAWEAREPSRHDREDRKLAGLIEQIFDDHHGRYGSPRVWAELKDLGLKVSRKRVERLMREHKIWSRWPRQRVITTDSGHKMAIADNILSQVFYAANPGEKWVSDITYQKTKDGWLYLIVIIDLCDRKVIGWSMSKAITAYEVCKALKMAVANRPPQPGLIFHSDRGVQYCSEEFRSLLKKLCPTVRQSMSRKGNCWDNACAESFFKTLKTELSILDGKHTSKEVKTAIFEYVEIYYNRCRRHSALGYATPEALTANSVA